MGVYCDLLNPHFCRRNSELDSRCALYDLRISSFSVHGFPLTSGTCKGYEKGYEEGMTTPNPRSRNTGLNRLSAVFVRQARAPGVYLDGGGLRFQVTRSGGRRWFMRATVNGNARDIALGQAEVV
jgi:hypothetical protein